MSLAPSAKIIAPKGAILPSVVFSGCLSVLVVCFVFGLSGLFFAYYVREIVFMCDEVNLHIVALWEVLFVIRGLVVLHRFTQVYYK